MLKLTSGCQAARVAVHRLLLPAGSPTSLATNDSVALTALIIDDEPLARQELLYLLQSAEGVEVLAQGSNGIEAVELIRAHKPDVVFLDVQMPGLDGFAVLKKLLDKKTEPAAGGVRDRLRSVCGARI